MEDMTAHDLMCIFDALVDYSIRPEFRDCPTINAYHEELGAKIERKLNAMGYHFDGDVKYTGNQR